MTDTVVSKWLF